MIYGDWNIVRDLGMRKVGQQNRHLMLVKCKCGNEKEVRLDALKSKHSLQCRGCSNINKSTTHGMRHTPEYGIWAGMIQRCYNVKMDNYKRYGGRGITVCNRWLESFENFIADMGKRPSAKHSIDRINNDGNYEPSNCRWATGSEQQKNKGGLKK